MRAKPPYRDRPEVEVAVLDALVDRAEGGMTVFELRAATGHAIDDVEEALASLKEDSLIEVESASGGVRLFPADRVVPDPGEAEPDESGLLDRLRDMFG
jgi:hypothetical protein